MLEKISTILYLSGDPITITKVAELTGALPDEVVSTLPELKERLEVIGLTLIITERDISIVTKPELAPLVELFRKDELKGDLTPATLQVLTLVAYLGSVTREQISYIRGVQSAQSIRTLLVRGLITKSGEVCSLSVEALQMLGVTSKEELPDYQRISSEFLKRLSTKEE
jgi:segregation and condensation protein B